MADEPLIAVRIKDGIFVGNAAAAHDDDFLMTNKITHVLNCAGTEVKDLFSAAGVHYLTFHWKDSAAMQGLSTHSGVMFDPADTNIDQTVRFLDKGMADGECVLVHDVHGTSRACALVAAYFVVKFGWRLDNALAFMQMAHQEMEIKAHWMRQLRAFAKRHEVDMDVFDPEVDDKRFSLDNDQWMLRNTLLNGLTANIQDSNALYQQCAKDTPPLEMTVKAQQRRRKRIVFQDTNQGTHVDSYSTTPVINARGGQERYRDPNSTTGSPSFLGGGGIGAIIEGRRSVVESIVARRSPVNTRRLESGPDVNAKGRQQLYRRVHSQPQYGTGIQQGGGQQPLQRINSLTNRQEQFAEAAATANSSAAMNQRNATPTSAPPGTTTPLRTSTTIQRHAPSVTSSAAAPPPTAASLQRAGSPLARRAADGTTTLYGAASSFSASAPVGGRAGPSPTTNTNLTTPIKQPLKSATGTVRSPFSVGSGGVTARKGSPLPRQVSSGGASPSASASSSTVRREVVSSGYGYGQITPAARGSRPSSPGPQPHPSTVTSSFGSRYGASPSAGGSSPFVQRGAVSSRPQSPTQQRLVSGLSTSAYGGAASSSAASSGVVRRAISPRPTGTSTTTTQSSAITGSAGASSIQSTTGIRRANSPLTRTRIGSGAPTGPSSSAYGSPSMSAYSNAAAASGSRPASPMTQRTTTSAAMGVRPSSPSRRPTTLADQYLAGSAASSSGGGIQRGLQSSLAAPTASSIARRGSPTPVTRRY